MMVLWIVFVKLWRVISKFIFGFSWLIMIKRNSGLWVLKLYVFFILVISKFRIIMIFWLSWMLILFCLFIILSVLFFCFRLILNWVLLVVLLLQKKMENGCMRIFWMLIMLKVFLSFIGGCVLSKLGGCGLLLVGILLMNCWLVFMVGVFRLIWSYKLGIIGYWGQRLVL